MKIHHLNCGTLCPFGGKLTDGIGRGPAKLVCHCLLVETDNGLVLVDTGLGMKDVLKPDERFSRLFRGILRPQLLREETAVEQIIRLGFKPSDVRHIILTHLDLDHAGGIDDFPHAEVHLMEGERRAVEKRSSFISRHRYAPAQLTSSKLWNTYASGGERWFGFKCVRALAGLPPEILLVPLAGHTEGHAGIAIQTDQGWLLHAGDAYFHRAEMHAHHRCTPGLNAFQSLTEVDRRARLMNQERLRLLAYRHGGEVSIFCAHDAIEFLALKEGITTRLKGSKAYSSPSP